MGIYLTRNKPKSKICFFIVISALIGMLIGVVFNLLIYANQAAAASDSIKIIVNGELLNLDVEPVVVENRTLVPLRAIAEALGCSVGWNVKTQTATISGPMNIIKVRINSYYILKTSVFESIQDEEIEIDVPPITIRGRTMVPARAISESLNATVEWIQSSNTVVITTDYEWDEIKGFSDGFAIIRKGEKYGVVNQQAAIVVPIIYDKILPFSDGLAEVEKDGVKFYIDDKNNQYLQRSDKKPSK